MVYFSFLHIDCSTVQVNFSPVDEVWIAVEDLQYFIIEIYSAWVTNVIDFVKEVLKRHSSIKNVVLCKQCTSGNKVTF